MVQYPPDPGATVAERSVRMVTALTAELAVLRERVAVLEKLVEDKGVLAAGAIDHYRPDADTAASFRNARLGLIARVFRALQV